MPCSRLDALADHGPRVGPAGEQEVGDARAEPPAGGVDVEEPGARAADGHVRHGAARPAGRLRRVDLDGPRGQGAEDEANAVAVDVLPRDAVDGYLRIEN